jgi:serine/threonine-protein kinase RsbW
MGRAAGSGDAPRAHSVELRIPADPEFRRLARLAAADVATRAGFDLEEIDDLRIGVDELCAAIVGPEAPQDRTVVLHFSFAAGTVEVSGRCRGTATPSLDELSRSICAAVVDEYALESVAGDRRFRLSKRAAA